MNGLDSSVRPAAGTGHGMDIVRYVIETQIEKVEHRDKVVKTYKRGDEVIEEKVDLGWFVTFKGSHESLFIGTDPPETLPKPGANARIILEWEC